MSRILVTGGAGFIGSNLIDRFLELGHQVICLDNLSTGFEHNISHQYNNPNFKFINGDIRNIQTCKEAIEGCDYISHQAALGSVPRSIADPANTNSVNIDGLLNMLITARDANVKRFVFAASSSTYGDSKKLPKVEDEIGKPLSPYAVTKLVNELYADVFSKTYGMKCIGLRYFNVFGKRQDPNGAYAAVIPLWVKKMIDHKRPVINGDGSFSRDFTYIENVIQANEKALFNPDEEIYSNRKKYYSEKVSCLDNNITENLNTQVSASNGYCEIFNIAFGGNTTLIELFEALRKNLAKFDDAISEVQPQFGPVRSGDIPHSQASISKAQIILGYKPEFNAAAGFQKVSEWYFTNLK